MRREPNRKWVRKYYAGSPVPEATESQIIKRMVRVFKKRPPTHGHQRQLSEALLDPQGWYEAIGMTNARRLSRRVMKKLRQPHRNKHNRGAMRAKAAGKNEIRGRR